MTLEEFERKLLEDSKAERLEKLRKGYLTPRKYSNLLRKKSIAESAAEEFAKLERGENFEDELRMVLHAYSAVMHWSEDFNHRVGGLSKSAPSELKETIEALESLAEQLEGLACDSYEAEEVREVLEPQEELWNLPKVSEETLKG